jgi:apolipoprotein D and lipocalin family protein
MPVFIRHMHRLRTREPRSASRWTGRFAAWNNLALALLLCLAGCTGLPENVVPVSDFKLEKYLGTWYEIARLDHSFERGLTRVTADYSLRDDGGVRVLNRGYSARDSEGYQYSLVSGPDKSYLWILARRPKLDQAVLETLIAKAAMAGFDTSKLIFVDHN